ncbi:DUF3267 domain-containing protein [Maribellus maritimus]|uniref:DUF3267 domain-containing protein n=1 Tax=Maribellus maritimus TaxID=2870838 RepID=UPI001EEB7D18|nr:DUF3267 domain-containing protein [Maribellus maritimus]MCG6185994.1 DUF3267 domain-containing protein [Maribellus maritimus]
MKFIYNKFPDDENFSPEKDKWTPLKEPDNLWTSQLWALPFMIINPLVIILILKIMGITFALEPANIFLSFLILMPIHEFIHALFFPEKLKSDNIFVGFTMAGFAFFAAYIGEMKRNRFIVILLAPLIIISLLGIIILALVGSNSLLEHIIVWNSFGACVDCLGVFMVSRQVPRNAYVRNKKIRTYWRI